MKNEALFNTLKAGLGNGLKCKTSLGVMQLTEINMTSRWTCWFGYDNKINSKHFNANICVKNGLVSKGFYPKKIKPYLFSTEDLVNEIEIGGRKFVPMLKLLELQETNFFYENPNLKLLWHPERVISCVHMEYKFSDKRDFIVKYAAPSTNMGDLVYSFTYDPELKRFATRDESNRRPLGIAFQLNMFRLLESWHFNIFDLPEDQYIRVTNENNPYK